VNLKKKRKTNRKTGGQLSKKQRVLIKSEENIKIEVLGSRPKPEKHKKRLEANKKSAQASRERKKVLRTELEIKLEQLSSENKTLNKEIIELETENKVLKSEFIQLQKIIAQTPTNLLNQGPSRANSQTLGKIGKTTNGNSKPGEGTPTSTFSGAAFMYLIIVLQSFSQHFSSIQPKSMVDIPPNNAISVR